MSYTIELNNARKDADFVSGKVHSKSTVVEIFSAMVDGKDIAPYGEKGKASEKYIKELNAKAANGDMNAISEINEIRRFAIEPILLKEIKLMSIFGNYKAIGWNDSCEVEVPEFALTGAEIQAAGQDVKFSVKRRKRVPIGTTNVSAGYAVDYRKAALGDMSDEKELQEQVRIQIRNKAAKYVIDAVYNGVKDATGVKYFFEGAGLTKSGVDEVIAKVRRFGRPTISGDYALLSQFNGFAGYAGVTPAVNGISEAVMNEIHNTGLMGMYNGSPLAEIPNEYDLTTLNADGTNFETMIPAGLGFVMPTGGQAPVYTVTRGGLTSLSGVDVSSGQLITRYDLEVGCLFLKERAFTCGVLHDTNLDQLAI